jgi:histone demethylase JARID1
MFFLLVDDVPNKRKLVANLFCAMQPSASQASEFDDMRQCFACKAICVFSAVACECDQTRVACMRHFPTMCKCPAHRKFMLGESLLLQANERRPHAQFSFVLLYASE